jgi:hypothetical protein
MADLLLGLRPEAARTIATFSSKVLDEFPVAEREAPERALGHRVCGAEGVDLGENWMCHAPGYMRVDTRTQYPSAGKGPIILRARSRSGQTGHMAEGVEIDLAKLRQLIVENTGPGKRFSRRSLSLEASDGRNPDLIRDLMRVDHRKPTIESVSGICKALGIPLSLVVKGVDLKAESLTEWLGVTGGVAAGVWREQSEWHRDEWYEIEVDINTTPGAHTGLIVEGRSMDKVLPPGTILRCIDLIGSNMEPEDGDYVIVEQHRGGLVKKLSRRPDGVYELVAESTLPEFRDPITIGKPDASGSFDGLDDTTRVKAIVIDAFLALKRRRKRSHISG